MKTKILEKLQQYAYFIWLILLIFIALFVTYFYDTNKKKQIYLLQKSFHNIYLKKTIETINSGLTPRYIEVNYEVQKGDNYQNILDSIDLPSSEKEKFLKTVKKLKEIAPDLKILVGQSSGITIPDTEDFLVEEKNIQVAISCSKLALASSGTVTLECAVLDTPVVVCYKLSYISNFILNIFNKSKYISIINILLGKKVVPELIQSNMNVTSIVKELSPLLYKSEMRKKMLNGFSEIRKLLGYPGSYERIANKILQKT